MSYEFIDPDKIRDMLFNDDSYVAEFCEAGLTSFEEFIDHYEKYLLDRNMEYLRKAGHKIKPGAQMMGAHMVVEEYENAKEMLKNEADQEELAESVQKMKNICSKICTELTELAGQKN
ncbi:MAG TPA: hypothetical protein VJ964_16515 [Balneolaceae bacterium]|nr:hypothetical protein [Balneolaceae bacterium]